MASVSVACGAFGAATTAGKVGLNIYEFISKTRNVSRSVRELAREVKQLEDVCNSVREQVERLKFDDEDGDLLTGVQRQLEDCFDVIGELDRAIDPIRKDKTNIFGQAGRQIKLDLTDDTIQSCRKRIQVNINNLSLSLQLLNIKAAFVAPRLANEVLLKELQAVRSTVDRHGKHLEKFLRKCADDYMIRGRTLYAESVATTPVRDAVPATQDKSIMKWLSTVSDLRTDCQVDTEDRSVSETLVASSQFGSVPDIRSKSLAEELVDKSFISAVEAHNEANYKNAESILLTCLARVNQGTVMDAYSVEALHYMLAVCAFHNHSPFQAEAALLNFINTPSPSSTQYETKCWRLAAKKLLARTYITFRELKRALQICEGVYDSYRPHLNENDEERVDTLALMIHICILSGDRAAAEVYKTLVPAGMRHGIQDRRKDAPRLHLQFSRLCSGLCSYPNSNPFLR